MEPGPRRAPGAASGAGQAIGGGDSRRGRGSPRRFPAFQRLGQGGELHALALAEAHALPGVSRVGAEQQPGRELDAPGGFGRKNWIHVGSQQAGPKVAAILSIVESCRRLKIPIREYLAAVVPGLADISIRRLAELTPSAWAAQSR